MGQLEKYGLYVLCLVIFLILGVTIWGEDAAAGAGAGDGTVAMRSDPATAGTGRASRIGGDGSLGGGSLSMLAEGSASPHNLLGPVDNPPKYEGPELASSRGGSDDPIHRGRETESSQPEVDAPPADAPKPTVDPAPAAGTRTYKIQKGDILGTIAQKQLGSARYVDEIKRLNPTLDARRMIPGTEIKLPARVGGAAARSDGPARGGDALSRAGAYRSYKIRRGDSFASIARRELGAESRLGEIRDLNRNVDPRRLQPGQTIKLPVK